MRKISEANVVKKTIWKKIAIIFVALFCIVLVVGAVKMQRFKSSFETTSQEQMDKAKSLVSQELSKKGEDINSYEFKISKKIRKGHRGDSQSKIVQVSLSGNSSLRRDSYIVDLEKEKILMHSMTEFYDLFPGEKMGDKRFPTGRFFLDKRGQ